MGRHFLNAVGLGIVGILGACGVVYGAVSSWTTVSSHWINSGCVLPILGLTGGLALAEPSIGERRNALRWALIAAAVPLATVGNYLAWLITVRTWFADRIPAEHQGFLFQLTHPSVLPSFVEQRAGSSYASSETYLQYLLLGAVLGPIILWLTTRRPLRAAR